MKWVAERPDQKNTCGRARHARIVLQKRAVSVHATLNRLCFEPLTTPWTRLNIRTKLPTILECACVQKRRRSLIEKVINRSCCHGNDNVSSNSAISIMVWRVPRDCGILFHCWSCDSEQSCKKSLRRCLYSLQCCHSLNRFSLKPEWNSKWRGRNVNWCVGFLAVLSCIRSIFVIFFPGAVRLWKLLCALHCMSAY